MADGREAANWHRTALVAAAVSGGRVRPMAFVPERYRPPEPEYKPPTEEESTRGWLVLMKGMESSIGEPPAER